MLKDNFTGFGAAKLSQANPEWKWTICHIDLSVEIPDLSRPAGAQGIYAFLWYGPVPLGQLELYASQLPLTAQQWLTIAMPEISETVGSYVIGQGFQAPRPCAFGTFEHVRQSTILSELVNLDHPLARLLDQRERIADAASIMSVSIIVCTRDRPMRLANCLKALDSLAILPKEVIVVDNAPSTGDTKELVSSYPNVHYVLEPTPGLSRARNAGILAATSDLVAFTDDDVVVHPYWVQELRTAFLNPNVMAMTGLVLPAQLDSKAQYIFENGINGFSRGYRSMVFDYDYFRSLKRFGVPTWLLGAGANMAFRRDIFERLGGFDVRLGAGASGCSEDSEMWYRILADGWSCQYCPSAVVSHFHRADKDSLRQQSSAYMKGHVVALIIQAYRHQHWGNLRRLLIALPRYYSKRVVLAMLNMFRAEHSYLISEIGGYFLGFVYYFRHGGLYWHQSNGLVLSTLTETMRMDSTSSSS